MSEEAERTHRVRDQGVENGLFRACMDTIERSHAVGQGLRTAMLAAGLMTDRRCYGELLGQFYLCTAALERALASVAVRPGGEPLSERLLSLGYAFTAPYEADLAALFGDADGKDWRATVERLQVPTVQRYVEEIEAAGAAGDGATLAAATFILWGPLVIGGGAALSPTVKRQFGRECTHVFEQVTGAGRSDRRSAFIRCYDTLLEPFGDDDQGSAARHRIVQQCSRFMDMNNALMTECKERPWWTTYLLAAAAAATAVGYWRWLRGGAGAAP
jgi:hypothetical protein